VTTYAAIEAPAGAMQFPQQRQQQQLSQQKQQQQLKLRPLFIFTRPIAPILFLDAFQRVMPKTS
jgi:hypothetical protein